MEIKIGIQSVSREITLDLDKPLEELREMLQNAMKNSEILDLTDKRDARLLINGKDISYVEFAPEHQNRIGFAL